MPQIEVKYKIGDDVSCGGIQGKATALYIRGSGTAYEFSYVDNNGNPTSCNVEECSLEAIESQSIGFRRRK